MHPNCSSLTNMKSCRQLFYQPNYRSAYLYSISLHIRSYFFESQAAVSSYFKGTKTNFKVYRLLFEGASGRPFQSLSKMFGPIICFGSVNMDLIAN